MKTRSGQKLICCLILIAISLLGQSEKACAQTYLTLANPDWNITLTDAGYSDFLLDNTPGFEGREYLSGEWGAAVGYEKTGGGIRDPEWLEPHFVFPDWNTLSTYTVVSPITQIGLNADGLPISESVIANGDLRITIRNEMIDTVVGTPMGIEPASSPNAGNAINSDRYVMKQTCTIKNVSGVQINNLSFFQFLHSLNGQRGMFDNRFYAGALSDFQYDVTQAGVDAWAVSPGSSDAGLEDYIGFHANIAPGAFEIGHYGIEGNGVDDHFMGKPSDGVHLSVENNWLSSPYAERQGTDSFNPPTRWVAGAQRFDLGSLAPNQSAAIDIILSLRTGTRVVVAPGSSGGCNGGSSVPGGFDYVFDDVTDAGSCFGEYSKADENELSIRIADGGLDPVSFPVPGYPVQIWKVDFSGTFSGDVFLTFAYDPTALPPGFDEDQLCLYEYDGSAWVKANGTTDSSTHTVSITTGTLTTYILGVDSLASYTIDALADPPDGGSVSGGGTYGDGSSATMGVTADPDYVFAGWTENGVPVSSSPHYTFIVHTDRTITANFVLLGSAKAVSTSSEPSNGGSTSGDGAYAPGSPATVVATANTGYKFSKWLLNGSTFSTSRSNTFTVTSNVMLVAKFKPVYYVTVTAVPANGGDLEADPAYEVGELAKLKAKPNAGYSFEKWTQNGLTVSTATNYQFNVNANRDLVGHFALGNRIDVIAEPVNGGSASGGGIYTSGSGVLVEAVANPGYVFVNWTEGGSPVSTDPSYGFSSAASRSLTANFIAQPELETTLAAVDALNISWPAGAQDWVLQECVEVGVDPWSDSAEPVDVIDNRNQITINPSVDSGFFRLYHP